MSKPSSTQNASGARTGNVCDYVLLHDVDATSEVTERPVIIDVRGIVAGAATFHDSVSDHRSVVAVFKTNAEDGD